MLLARIWYSIVLEFNNVTMTLPSTDVITRDTTHFGSTDDRAGCRNSPIQHYVHPDGSTNVQRWPQDPYFPFSSLVLHFSGVWKCEITLLSLLIPSSMLIKRVEVWNSQSQDNVTLFPWSRNLCRSLLSSTLLKGVEVWKKWRSVELGKEWQRVVRLSLLWRTIPHFYTSEKCRTK